MANQSVDSRRWASIVRRAFGAVLTECLRAPGVSVSRVARDAGITRAYLHRLARGQSQPSLSTMLALAAALPIEATKLTAMVKDKAVELSP